ncbi:MAG TPA: hypothetical protein VJ625_00665 [Propionibacteriaceae bacterium]|nr:hypothetical protein [Propionibacteriaceae bacterium]
MISATATAPPVGEADTLTEVFNGHGTCRYRLLLEKAAEEAADRVKDTRL